MSRIARIHGLHPTTPRKALREPCYAGEQAIAVFLGKSPREICCESATMAKLRDPNTLDMFTDWQPPVVAVNLPPEVTNGGNLGSQIARAVGRTLKAGR